MMLELIGSHHGDALSRKVAEWFVHEAPAILVGKLERAFKVEFDMGPAEYFRRARMEVHGFLQDGRAAANVTSVLLGIATWMRGVIRPPDGSRGREP